MPWEFAKFNLLSGHSAMYGEHSWHWNFTQVSPWLIVAFQGGFMGRHTSPGTSACCRVVKSGSAILQMPARAPVEICAARSPLGTPP